MKTVEQLIADELKRREYRTTYNKRPEVKAKRAAYMNERNTMMRAVYQMYKNGQLDGEIDGEIGTRVDMGTGEVEA